MTNSQDDLAKTFRDYSDEKLYEAVESGNLTDMAEQLAVEELKRRGLDYVPATGDDSEGSQDGATTGTLVTVAEFATITDALIIRGKLEAEGIPSTILDSFLGASNAFMLTGPKCIRVQVDQAFASQAIAMIQAIQRGDYDLDKGAGQSESKGVSQPSYMNLEDGLVIFAQDAIWLKIWRGLIDKTSHFASFNPFAAVMGIAWLFFRKMYGVGILVLFADQIALHFIGPWGVICLVRIPLGLLANIVYFKKAQKAVYAAQAAQLPNEQGIERLKRQGGINMFGALLGIVITLLLRVLLSMMQ